MKRLIALIATILICSVGGNSGEVNAQPSGERVFVVMSPNAQVYHRTTSCSGLRNAKHPIKEVSIEKATREMKRRACKICYGG